MRRIPFLAVLLVQPLAAQTIDIARVTIGLSGGYRSGRTLWDIPNQPILAQTPYPPDLFHLRREVSAGFTLSGQATIYSSPQFGITFELTYLGLKLDDTCSIARDGGDTTLTTACTYVGSSARFGAGYSVLGAHDAGGVDHSATAILFEGGVILRPFKPAPLQPYFKGLAGFATTPHSTVAMESVYGDDPTQPGVVPTLIIYSDGSPPPVRPVLTLAAGMTTAPTSGFQVHFEARSTFIPQSVVTGPTTAQYLSPPNHSVIQAYWSLLVGMELVVKRQHGKRY